MTDSAEESAARLFRELDQIGGSRQDAIDATYSALQAHGLLAKVTLHRYQCKTRGCQIATVFRVDGLTLCAVRDYKFSPGLNMAESVESARARNTLDGDRHWPGHVYDVEQLHGSPEGVQAAGIPMICNHSRETVLTRDILAAVEGVTPGRPGRPTRL